MMRQLHVDGVAEHTERKAFEGPPKARLQFGSIVYWCGIAMENLRFLQGFDCVVDPLLECCDDL